MKSAFFSNQRQPQPNGVMRDFKNYTSKKFLELLNDKCESRSDWLKIVFEYHGKFKNKQ